MVSGQGKWQEWMPKLERSRSDHRKTLLSSACRHSSLWRAWEREPPGQCLVQTRWEGPASWRIFRTSETTRHLGRQGPWVYRSQLRLFAVCRQTHCQGGLHQQSSIIVAHRDEYAPGFDLLLHRLQINSFRAGVIFLRRVLTFIAKKALCGIFSLWRHMGFFLVVTQFTCYIIIC